jgi:ribosomal protein L17
MLVEEKIINNEKRYIIVDTNGNVIDDAQGYGYKNRQNAHKVIYYRKNKKKIHKKESDIKIFWKKNKELKKYVEEMIELNFKEILRKEITIEDIRKEAMNDFDIEIPKGYIKKI